MKRLQPVVLGKCRGNLRLRVGFAAFITAAVLCSIFLPSSEATQKSQLLPGGQSEVDPQRHKTVLDTRGGQQDEPGLALSPDGPGASPEPPTLSNTLEGNAATDTLASEMLRKLAGVWVGVGSQTEARLGGTQVDGRE